MKVKSFSVGTVNGVDDAMEILDKHVQKLGDGIVFYSVVDTIYEGVIAEQGNGPRIVRVVTYTD